MNITELASQLYNIFFVRSTTKTHKQKSDSYFDYLQTFRNLFIDNKLDTEPLLRLTWLIYMHRRYLDRADIYPPKSQYYQLLLTDIIAIDREILTTLANCNQYLSQNIKN